MKIKHVLVSVIAAASLLVSSAMPAFAAGSPDVIEGKNLSWNVVDGKSYWYEDGKKQGITSDTKCFSFDGTLRGREIYDKASDGWYWLDVLYDGAKAVNKEVFMPYIFQGESSWSDALIRDNANMCDEGMRDFIYNSIKSKTGKWVRYDENGKMMKGWVTIQGDLAKTYPKQKGNTYYYDTITGVMAKGWITLADGIAYHFDEKSGKLLEAKTDKEKGEDAVTIYYDGLGTPGKMYAVEADLELQGTGTGYQALLTVGNGDDSIKFGLTFDTSSTNESAKDKFAVASEVYVGGNLSGSRNYHDIYYTGNSAKCNLLMFVDSSSGYAWFFHNHKYVTAVKNDALIGDPLYIRAEGRQLGSGIVSASFKNVKVKSPVNGEELVTMSGTPTIGKKDVKDITYIPYLADTANGYANCGVTATNSTTTNPKDAYGYLEFVSVPTTK